LCHQIIRNVQLIFQRDDGLPPRRERNVDRVAERDRLEDGAQLVKLIRPAIENVEIQVELSQRGDAGAAGGGAHWSYWSSEKTSCPRSFSRPLRKVSSTTKPTPMTLPPHSSTRRV